MEPITTALELMPLLKVVNANHRLGIEVSIDRDKISASKQLEYMSSWAYARKGKLPSFFTLIYAGVDKNGCIMIDNYCNTCEDGCGVGDRGECAMLFNGKFLNELHDLN